MPISLYSAFHIIQRKLCVSRSRQSLGSTNFSIHSLLTVCAVWLLRIRLGVEEPDEHSVNSGPVTWDMEINLEGFCSCRKAIWGEETDLHQLTTGYYIRYDRMMPWTRKCFSSRTTLPLLKIPYQILFSLWIKDKILKMTNWVSHLFANSCTQLQPPQPLSYSASMPGHPTNEPSCLLAPDSHSAASLFSMALFKCHLLQEATDLHPILHLGSHSSFSALISTNYAIYISIVLVFWVPTVVDRM